MPIWAATFIALVAAACLLRLSGRSAILKDQLIPQIPPGEQSFSLARTQMAWWFLIILGCAVYLVLLRIQAAKAQADYAALLTTLISPQSLALMGLSALTAGAAAAVDTAQYTTEDKVNDALKQLKLGSYGDVLELRAKIADWTGKAADDIVLTPTESKGVATAHTAKLAQNPGWSPAQQAAALAELTTAAKTRKRTGTITDLQRISDEYERQTARFRTQGWLADMATDVDGAALHRLQALIWSLLIGGAFIYVTLKTGAMPQLDDNLLGLMGISSAGYVGFKYNETQY